MKKLISLLLTLTLLATAVVFAIPVSAEEDTTVTDSTDTTEDNFLYSEDGLWKYMKYSRTNSIGTKSTGEDEYGYNIVDYYGDETDVTLPEEIDGNKITGLSLYDECSIIENLTIPVTYDYIDAVHNTNLKTVTFSRNYEVGKNVFIDLKTFSRCTNLESVVLPNIMTYTRTVYTNYGTLISSNTYSEIPSYCFANCTSLKSIVFPEDITEIGMGAFMGCTSLEELTIPEGVELIDEGAFQDCTSLKELVIPEGVETIKRLALYGCTSLKTLTLPDSLTYLKSFPTNVSVIITSNNNEDVNEFISSKSETSSFVIINPTDTEVAGDTNGDGTLDIKDVTVLQKRLADIYTFDINNSDYNGDGKTNIRDATEMQRALAHISS